MSDEIKYEYLMGDPYPQFDYNWVYDQARYFSNSFNPNDNPKSYEWSKNNWCPINIVIPNRLDFDTGEEVQYSIDHAANKAFELCNFSNSSAFDQVRRFTSVGTRTLLIYVGKGKSTEPFGMGPGQVQAHVHTPKRNADGKYLGPRMTTTVVIPIKIVEPVTETLCFAWQDIPYDQMNINEEALKWESSLSLLDSYNDRSNMQRIKFPEMGQHLVFTFNSSNYLHWSELDTNNEFICLVQDC